MSATEQSRSAYTAFHARNPDLRSPRPDATAFNASRAVATPTPVGPRVMITLGPIVSPRNRDRDNRARELKANRSDITALANAPYHCGVDDGVDPLTSGILAAVDYTCIGTDDVVACHNGIIDVHRCTLQMWHKTMSNTFGPQVNRILEKSLKLFPVLESTTTADAVEFYDRLQETAANHLLALMPFDAIMLRFGFEGLCVPGLGVTRYSRMGKALMDLLPHLVPGTLSPQINAALYLVRYESNNGYDCLWRVLELLVPGFDPIVPIQIPVWMDYEDIFRFTQGYLLYFWLQAKMYFHYNDRTCSGIFLHAIQFTDYADTVTTLQAQVNTFWEFDDRYLPSHLRLHGLATSIHQNAMSWLQDIGTPHVHRLDGGNVAIQGIPTVHCLARQRDNEQHRGGNGDRGGYVDLNPGDKRRDRARESPRDGSHFASTLARSCKPRGPVSNPDRNRQPYLADVQCDACKCVGHVAKHCNMLATAICLERYMKNVLSPLVWDTIKTKWLARWKNKLGNPTATLHQILRAYVKELDITVVHLDDAMEWSYWDEEDDADDSLDN
jgi:hypothetical protein